MHIQNRGTNGYYKARRRKLELFLLYNVYQNFTIYTEIYAEIFIAQNDLESSSEIYRFIALLNGLLAGVKVKPKNRLSMIITRRNMLRHVVSRTGLENGDTSDEDKRMETSTSRYSVTTTKSPNFGNSSLEYLANMQRPVWGSIKIYVSHHSPLKLTSNRDIETCTKWAYCLFQSQQPSETALLGNSVTLCSKVSM